MNKRIRKKRIRQTLLIELSLRFPNTEDALAWLDAPLPEFEGRTPRDTIAAGEIERVTVLLDGLNTAAESAA